MPEEIIEGAAPAAPVASEASPNPAPSPAPAPGNPSGDWERKFKGIQADLQKERKQRQEYERASTQYQTELQAERRRVQALAGVNTPNPADAERAEIRARLNELRPELADLTAEEIAEWRAMAKDRKQLADTTQHYWHRHSKSMLDKVTSSVAKEIGGKLTDRQAQQIAAAYVNRAQSDDAFAQRHEDGDESLIAEFAKDWAEDWIAPARRLSQQQDLGRRQLVPDGKGRALTTAGAKPIDVNDPKAVMDLLVQGRTFGR